MIVSGPYFFKPLSGGSPILTYRVGTEPTVVVLLQNPDGTATAHASGVVYAYTIQRVGDSIALFGTPTTITKSSTVDAVTMFEIALPEISVAGRYRLTISRDGKVYSGLTLEVK